MTLRLLSSFILLVSICILPNSGNAQTTFPVNAKILCLGDSRVEGDPTFESYRYEFWKDLVDCNWTFDLIGEESDPITYPTYQNMTFDPDQFGGAKGKKFMVKKMREYVLSISHLPMKEQHKKIKEVFSNWKGDFEQVDDVCVIGIKI